MMHGQTNIKQLVHVFFAHTKKSATALDV